MKRLIVFIAAIISVTFWISTASPADRDSEDLRSQGLQRIALQDAIATAQIAEAIEELNSYGVGHIVSVGVLSTGVDEGMPGLKSRVLPGATFVAHEPDIIDRNGAGARRVNALAAVRAAQVWAR